MKAKRKPLEVVSLEELGVSVENNLAVTDYTPPMARSKGILVEDTGQLVGELKNRGLI